jgi:hypothetical protein
MHIFGINYSAKRSLDGPYSISRKIEKRDNYPPLQLLFIINSLLQVGFANTVQYCRT